MYILVILFAYASYLHATIAEGIIVENRTLQEVLKSTAPVLQNSALSATFIRTNYTSQSLQSASENISPDVERTIISELLVNSDGITESLCDARTTGLSVKQYAFHYSNDGIYAKVYDSRNNKGIVRKSPQTISNYLSCVFNPYVVTSQCRFISRGIPTFLSKLKEAQITTETSSVIAGTNCITLEGEYKNSDPERYFNVTIIPTLSYAITKLEEYDKNKRILLAIDTSDYVAVSGLWLPKKTVAKTYKYDDHEGNIVQIARLDILEPKAVSIDEDMFSLKFPTDAKLYDATSGIDIGEMIQEADKGIEASIEGINIREVQVDVNGDEIVNRTKQAYKHENISESIKLNHTVKNEKIVPTNPARSRTLQMPEPYLKQLIFKIAWGLFVITITGVVLYIIRKKIRLNQVKTKGREVA